MCVIFTLSEQFLRFCVYTILIYFNFRHRNLLKHPQIENVSTFIFVCWTPKNFEKFVNENEKYVFYTLPVDLKYLEFSDYLYVLEKICKTFRNRDNKQT
jgi:hypothetical protein